MPDHNCFHEDDFKRLESMLVNVFGKMDKFIDELNVTIREDTRREERMNSLEKDVNRSFEEIRILRKDLKTISDWRQRFEGGIKVMLAIPVVCTIITTCIAIYKMVAP